MAPSDDTSDEEPIPAITGGMEDLEEAWGAYTQMEATGWHHLPYAGGLLDQPELLMQNIYRIANAVRQRREAADGTTRREQ